MFVVKHKMTGLYYKKGNIRSAWDSQLVTKDKATVYRTHGGAVMSVGHMVTNEKPKMRGNYKYLGVHYVLDESIWEIEPVEIQ